MQKNINIIQQWYKKNIKKYFNYTHISSSSLIFCVLYSLMLLSGIYFISQYSSFLQRDRYFPSYSTDYYFSIEKSSQALKSSATQRDIYDFSSDNSYQKYIDPQFSFAELDYIPNDLRSLSWAYIIDTRGDLRLRDEAATAFELLAAAFYKATWEKVVVVSSYRSFERQRQIKTWWCPDHLCAKAWYSEHQSGLAIDIWSATTEAYWISSPRLMRFFEWFQDNAYIYWYHNSYQNGVEIDWYAVEPWHWRYLGVDLAGYLYETEQTFAQYFYSL